LLLRVFRTPWEGKGFGKALTEKLAWLGLEDFRGLVGAGQYFLQEELISLESEYVTHRYLKENYQLAENTVYWEHIFTFWP
jgi:hypothetical protein